VGPWPQVFVLDLEKLVKLHKEKWKAMKYTLRNYNNIWLKLSGNLNISFAFVEGESLLMAVK